MARLAKLFGRSAAWCLVGFVALVGRAGAIDKNYSFSIEPQGSGKEYALIARNDGPAPVLAQVTFTELDNALCDAGSKFHVVVPPRSERAVARISAATPGGEQTFRFTYRWRLGDPQSAHRADALYRLPFAEGLSFTIIQGPGGFLSTHSEGGQEWAVDIPMPVGTPIVAARQGVVVEAIGEFGEGGTDPALMGKTNYVRILHSDGTFSTYAHLLQDSLKVRIGDRVKAGTVLALSGNSGYSSGPHLHFAVERYDGQRTVSVPFRFYSGAQGAFSPVFGLRVTSDYPSAEFAAETPSGAVGGMR